MGAAVGAIGAATSNTLARKTGDGPSFGEILSCLNPLQYLPVVGTIYRAVTGDTIPAPVRALGSLIFSGLTSGPVGVGIALGVGAAERAVGFDEERFGQSLLASIGVGHGPAKALAPGSAGGSVAAVTAGGTGAFSQADLTQFGLSRDATGMLSGRGLTGADALNAMELSRLASTAYAKAGALV